MNGMNKRGISAIVATVLIILITVAAVTIIWAAIIPMISDQLGRAQECTSALSQLTVKGEYSCYVSATATTNGTTRVQIVRGAENIDLRDILLLVGANGSLSSISVKEDLGGEILDPTEEHVFVMINDYNATDGGNFSAGDTVGASVAPVIFTGNEEVTCDNSGSTVVLKPCPS